MENNRKHGEPDDNLRSQQQNNEYERQKSRDNNDRSENSFDPENPDLSDAHYASRHDDRDMKEMNDKEPFSRSSADDQPSTTTDTNLGRDRDSS